MPLPFGMNRTQALAAAGLALFTGAAGYVGGEHRGRKKAQEKVDQALGDAKLAAIPLPEEFTKIDVGPSHFETAVATANRWLGRKPKTEEQKAKDELNKLASQIHPDLAQEAKDVLTAYKEAGTDAAAARRKVSTRFNPARNQTQTQ